MRRVRPVTKSNSFTPAALCGWAQEIKNGLAENPLVFTSLPISLLVQQAAIDDFKAAIIANGTRKNHGSSEDRARMISMRNLVRENIRKICRYVDIVAEGDVNIILLAKLIPSREPHTLGVLEAPQNVRSLFSNKTPDECYRLHWNKVKGAVAYHIFFSADANVETKTYLKTVRSSYAVFPLPGCPSFTLRYFWIKAIGGSQDVGLTSQVCTARNK